MFDLVNEAAQGARAKLVYVVAEVVLVDAFTQSDCLVESVDFHRSTPGGGPPKHLGHLVGPGVQVVRSAVIERSGYAVATRSDTTPDASTNVSVAQQLSCGLCRHGGSESGQVNAASGTASLIFVRVGFLAVAGHRLGVVDLFEHPQPD